jgi:RNA polymerase sigma-70 factor (ECF subfamily)
VLLAAQSQVPGSKSALAELCRIYWYPIYASVRHRGYAVDDAQDLTQGFFLHLLSHKALRQVSPLKGKFRSFLGASLRNYLSDEADDARRLKRGGNVKFVPLDAETAEYRYQLESPGVLTADKMFDARWAITLLDRVMARLEEEYAAQEKRTTFKALKPFLSTISTKGSLSYQQLAKSLHVRVGSVKTLVHRLRKRYTILLREEVGRPVSDAGEIDEEIHGLCEALLATEGQLSRETE